MLEKVKKIWEDALSTEDIDVDESFFDLGGNSMIGFMIMDGIESQFNIEIETTDLYNYDTVTKMAQYIEKKCKQEA